MLVLTRLRALALLALLALLAGTSRRFLLLLLLLLLFLLLFLLLQLLGDQIAIVERIPIQPAVRRGLPQRRRVGAERRGQLAGSRQRITAIVLGERIREWLQLPGRGHVLMGLDLRVGFAARVSEQASRRRRMAAREQSLGTLVRSRPQARPTHRMRLDTR
ncbi:MAG: hypothetical protein HKM03_04650 [Steroidobacteraceae bacterium]|nr:hypothetical protein [Steroidobacteraceae bacterium]